MAYALTSGPASPEFSSFEPVGTTDMVNLFSGDFTYNLPVIQIPGPEGSGYAMSLAYHSGVSHEEEASWVGYGWSLNPGAINRQVKGFPDDADSFQVKQYAKAPLNWTTSFRGNVNYEFFSFDDITKKESNQVVRDKDNALPSFDLNGSTSIRFNNYTGFARYYGFGIMAKGLTKVDMNVGLNLEKGPQGITYHPTASVSLNHLFGKSEKNTTEVPKTAEDKADDRKALKLKPHEAITVGSAYVSWAKELRLSKAALVPKKNYLINGVNFNNSPGGIKISPFDITLQTGLGTSFFWDKDEETSIFRGQGLMHHTGEQANNLLHDYYSEQDNPYSNRLYFTSVPFANYDSYNVSGENLSGSFRYVPAQLDAFYPNSSKSSTISGSLGLDLSGGEGADIGVNLGFTSQSQEISSTKLAGKENSKGQFRFNHDQGGLLSLKNFASLIPRYITDGSPRQLLPELDDSLWTRSSIITPSKFADAATNYNPSDAIISRNKSYMSARGQGKALSVMNILGPNGNVSRYGLPVLTKSESELSFSYKSPSGIENAIIYQNIPLKGAANTSDWNVDVDGSGPERIYGSVKNNPYVSSYLLTEILSPSYVDLNGNNRVDNADAGGWTQLQYFQKYGHLNASTDSAKNWYRWRMPYTGLNYSKGTISDKKDDVGTISTGLREVYYLKTVETKTHIAFFITNKTKRSRFDSLLTGKLSQIPARYLTGSDSARFDGIDAAQVGTGGDPAALSSSARGIHELEKLEAIVLFSKERPEKPLKTVRFAYDNSLVGRLPNSKNGAYGKLTLKKVWFEYEGVQTSLTLPYEFVYKYKNLGEFPDQLINDYPDLLNTGEWPSYSAGAQNPDYSPYLSDPWGFQMPFAQERKKYLNPWVYQGPLKPNTGLWFLRTDWRKEARFGAAKDYDPAAWQLKQIKLPSGGEIHVQYEQKDYAYVQDKAPMVMASLIDHNETEDDSDYWVDPEDLGLDTAADDYISRLHTQCDLINDYYKGKEPSKLAFKFLYLMSEHNGTQANLQSCMTEYITGYTGFGNAEVDSTKKTIKVSLATKGYDYNNDHPRRACYDYFTTRRYGMWDNCDSYINAAFDRPIRDLANSAFSIPGVLAAATMMAPVMAEALLNVVEYNIPDKDDVGTVLNDNLSYLKLPMAGMKRGGGARVKRLLTIDYGLESGDASVFGHEFSYTNYRKTKNGYEVISSGIATNEPSGARDESPFKTFLPMASQKWLDKIIAGESREQLEGPVGESLLPAAAIGHSRVVISSIHKGLSGTGHSVHEFYTCKDYPFGMSYPDYNALGKPSGTNSPSVKFNDLSATRDGYSFVMPLGIVNIDLKHESVRQGFEFRFNSMHGQVKANRDLKGDYLYDSVGTILSSAKVAEKTVVSATEYDYYKPGEPLPVLKSDKKLVYLNLGRESEGAVEQYNNEENSLDMSLEFDISVSGSLLITPTFGFGFDITQHSLSSLSRATVIRYPAVVKSVTSIKDGVRITQSNVGYDARSGEPILTTKNDDLPIAADSGKTVCMMQIPAYWHYPELAVAQNRLKDVAASITTFSILNKHILPYESDEWLMPQNILSAQATSLSNNRFNTTGDDKAGLQQYLNEQGISSGSSALTKLNALLLPEASFVYRSNVKKGSFDTAMSLSGYTTGAFSFPAANEEINNLRGASGWLEATNTTQFTVGSQGREERDANKIYSFAIFGKNELTPVFTGSNARAAEVAFEDYELSARGISGTAHTGSRAFSLSSVSQSNIDTVLKGPDYVRGATIQFWANQAGIAKLKFGTDSLTDMKPTAKCEEWYRYEAQLTGLSADITGNLMVLRLKATSPGALIDDLKILPAKTVSKAYVYDQASYKVLAEFDNLHFGTIYQYNGQGALVRKIKETMHGRRTIAEQHSNYPSARRQ